MKKDSVGNDILDFSDTPRGSCQTLGDDNDETVVDCPKKMAFVKTVDCSGMIGGFCARPQEKSPCEFYRGVWSGGGCGAFWVSCDYETTNTKTGEVIMDELLKKSLDALEWYAEKARSMANFDPKKPDQFGQKVIAIFTEMSLDGGRRAEEVRNLYEKMKGEENEPTNKEDSAEA